MGWAKYYEDNMSIYIGCLAAREIAPVFCDRDRCKNVKQLTTGPEFSRRKEGNNAIGKTKMIHKASNRKGLKVVFQNGIDERIIRKMQMNGWYWSKANACWYNRDTKGNRKYAKALIEIGARISAAM